MNSTPNPGTAPIHTLRLLLGDQLNPQHPWFGTLDASVVYVLMEVRQETDYVLHHAQKILAIFATMRDFARELRAGGHRVRYVALDDPGTASPSLPIWRRWPRITPPSASSGSSRTNGGWTPSCRPGAPPCRWIGRWWTASIF